MHSHILKLTSLTNAQSYLKTHISFTMLDDIVYQMTDNEAAKQLNEEKTKLFKNIFEQK